MVEIELWLVITLVVLAGWGAACLVMVLTFWVSGCRVCFDDEKE